MPWMPPRFTGHCQRRLGAISVMHTPNIIRHASFTAVSTATCHAIYAEGPSLRRVAATDTLQHYTLSLPRYHYGHRCQYADHSGVCSSYVYVIAVIAAMSRQTLFIIAYAAAIRQDIG